MASKSFFLFINGASDGPNFNFVEMDKGWDCLNKDDSFRAI